MNRPEAKELGLERYNTGRPCKHGHFSDRRTKSGICIACEPMYAKQRQHHPKTLATHKRMRARHRAKIIERVKVWRLKNPGRRGAQDARYREHNKEKIKLANERWLAKRPNYRAELERSDPERYRSYRRNTKARRKKAPGSHTAADVRAIYKAQRGKCGYCRVSLAGGYHVDHVIPIALGGSNDRQNLQLLCVPCNTSKGAKHPVEYARSRGLLI